MYQTKIVGFASSEAIQALRDGEVIAFPTETVYGLGVVYDSEAAFNKLVEVKRRPPDKPFTLMGGNNFRFRDFAYLDEGTLRVIHKFVPGPLTLLLKPKEGLYKHVTLNSSSIGIRVAGDSDLRDFIDRVGKPLLVPSANKSGEKPATDAQGVYSVFKGEIPYVIDAYCGKSMPSTIIDFSNPGELKLIRQGELSFEDIERTYKGE
jgi:L-threonylcarbamoyladenylate synthase